MAEDIKSKYACTVVRKEGVRYFKDANGLVVNKPVSTYTHEFNAARNILVGIYPELKRQMFKMDPIFTPHCDTFATGYVNKLFINPIFWNKLIISSTEDFPERISKSGKKIAAQAYNYVLFVIIHEMYHHIFGHMNLSDATKKAYPDHKRQNMAMDYAINGVIEDLYGMEGFTERIHGLINPAYTGLPWETIYPIITREEMERKNKPWMDIEDNKGLSKVNKNKEEGGDPGGGPQPPMPNINVKHNDDFKKGYADAKAEILSIIRSVGSINGTIEDLIGQLEPIATSYGVSINEGVSSFGGGNDSYDNGVRTAYSKVLEELYSKLQGIKKGGSKMDNEVKNDLDKILDDPTPPSSSDPSDSKENNEDPDNSSKTGENDNDETGNQDGYEDENDEENEGESKNGEGEDDEDFQDDWEDEMSDEDMRKALEEEGFDPDLNKDDTDGRTKEEKAQDREDLEKHMDHIAKDSKNEKQKTSAGKMKGTLDKLFPIVKVQSELDWKDLLKDFLNTTCTVSSEDFDDMDPLLGTPSDESPIPTEEIPYGGDESLLKHIVIGLDQSGSVCGAGNVPKFIGEVMNVIDEALNDDTIVDFIQFDATIDREHRILHKMGDTETEIEAVRRASGGGTDYYDVMERMSKLMDDWYENAGNTSVLGNVLSGETIDGVDVPEAACSVIFTDSDFFYGTKKYQYIDTNKLLIIGVDCDGSMNFSGDNAMFIDCFYPISSKSWKFNESANQKYSKVTSVNEMFLGGDDDDEDNGIQDAIQAEVDDSISKETTGGSINFLNSVMDDYCDVYKISKDRMSIDGDRIKIEGDVHISIPSGPSLCYASITGSLIYKDIKECPRNYKGVKVKNGIGLMSGDLTYEEYKVILEESRKAGDSEYKNAVYYVNCKQIMNGMISEEMKLPEDRRDTFIRYHAFSNNPNLIIDYVRDYVNELATKKGGTNKFDIRIGSLMNGGNMVTDIVEYDGVSEIPIDKVVCIHPIEDYEEGGVLGDEIIINVPKIGMGVNSLNKNQKLYGYDRPGLPPFIILDWDKDICINTVVHIEFDEVQTTTPHNEDGLTSPYIDINN